MWRLLGHIAVSCGIFALFGFFLGIFGAFFLYNPFVGQFPLLRIPGTILWIVFSVVSLYLSLLFGLALIAKFARILLRDKRENLNLFESGLWSLSEVCLDIVYNVSKLFFIHSPFPTFIYRLFGIKIGKGAGILGRVYDPSLVTIGDNSLIGTRTLVKPYSWESGKLCRKPVRIGANVTIGAFCSIGCNTTLEDGSVLAVGSMMPDDAALEKGWIYAGVPAKKLKEVASVSKAESSS